MEDNVSPTSSHVPHITWPQLVAVEPRLAELEFQVLTTVVPSGEPDYWRVWTRHKHAMEALCGWEAEKPELRTEWHYNAAFDHLLKLYQDCAYGGEQ